MQGRESVHFFLASCHQWLLIKVEFYKKESKPRTEGIDLGPFISLNLSWGIDCYPDVRSKRNTNLKRVIGPIFLQKLCVEKANNRGLEIRDVLPEFWFML